MEKLKTSEVNKVGREGEGNNCNPIILFGTGDLAELFYKKIKN